LQLIAFGLLGRIKGSSQLVGGQVSPGKWCSLSPSVLASFDCHTVPMLHTGISYGVCAVNVVHRGVFRQPEQCRRRQTEHGDERPNPKVWKQSINLERNLHSKIRNRASTRSGYNVTSIQHCSRRAAGSRYICITPFTLLCTVSLFSNLKARVVWRR
jgi:hypothetical protein